MVSSKNNYSDNDDTAFYFNHIHKIVYNKLMMKLFYYNNLEVNNITKKHEYNYAYI